MSGQWQAVCPNEKLPRRFWVGVTSVRWYLAQYQQAGSLERKPIPGCARRIGLAQEAILLARLEEAPDATVLEHCAWWAAHQSQQLSEAAMWRAMRQLGWTHKKKSLVASERNEEARAAWHAQMAGRNPEQFVFVDESGAHTSLTRLYGWASHEERAVGAVPRNHG